MPALIVVGDKTSHRRVVIGGSVATDTHGKLIARVGDRVLCPMRGHGGTTTIVSGDPTLIIDGSPAARHGDRTACGAVLLASQIVTTVDPGNGVAASRSPGIAALQSTPASTYTSPDAEANADQHFLLLDQSTKEP